MAGTRLVYSTEGGRVPDPRDRRPPASGAAPRSRPAMPQDGVVRIFRDRGGRAGKVVTVIRGLPERGPALAARAADLKRFCGAGGTVKDDGAIEVQGDQRERVAERLRSLGYTVKLAGGSA